MMTSYEVHTISFQTFFVWAFEIVVDSWKFSTLLLTAGKARTTWTLTKRLQKKLDGNYSRMLRIFWTSPGGNTPQGTNDTATCRPSRKLSKLDEPDMQDTAGEAGTSS